MAALVRTLALALFAAMMAAGCGLLPEVKDETSGWSAERIYRSAHDALLEGNYTRAVRLFEGLEARYPYGRYAQQALLESAYASYRATETSTAISTLDRFIRTYPNHPSVDYAYYLKGIVNFREDQGLFGYVYEFDLSERDPKSMKDAFAAFKELIAKFPDSRYSEDAATRMVYLANALSLYEVHVARYYYNRGAYIAAASRAQGSLVNYPKTPANEHALDVMMRAYDKLSLAQLRDDTQAILVRTYPGSPYLAGVPQKPWWKFWGATDLYSGVDRGTDSGATKSWYQFW
ncbi:MAG: outer membrane protein assembly factor BamD [Betaproteobacteria bacterium]